VTAQTGRSSSIDRGGQALSADEAFAVLSRAISRSLTLRSRFGPR
jgi:hypothetical protein